MGKMEEIYPLGAKGWATWRGLVLSQSDFSSTSGPFKRQQCGKCASGEL
jgi:hypothetical protein